MKLLKHYLFYCLLILTLALTFCVIFSTHSFASDPKFITTMNSSLKKIQRLDYKDKYSCSCCRCRYRSSYEKIQLSEMKSELPQVSDL